MDAPDSAIQFASWLYWILVIGFAALCARMLILCETANDDLNGVKASDPLFQKAARGFSCQATAYIALIIVIRLFLSQS